MKRSKRQRNMLKGIYGKSYVSRGIHIFTIIHINKFGCKRVKRKVRYTLRDGRDQFIPYVHVYKIWGYRSLAEYCKAAPRGWH